MSDFIKISAGSHASSLIDWASFYGNSVTLKCSVLFNSSCIYDDLKDGFSWNKLFGVSYAPPLCWLLKNPTKINLYTTAMVAWRCKNGVMEIAPYLHRQGTVEYPENSFGMDKVFAVDIDKAFIITLTISSSSVRYRFEFGEQSLNFTTSFPNHVNIGHYISTWFGGVHAAPHDMYLSLQKM